MKTILVKVGSVVSGLVAWAADLAGWDYDLDDAVRELFDELDLR